MSGTQENSSLRVVVVGAGVMGANHIRVVSQSSVGDLVAVVDPVAEKAQKAARGTPTYADLADCLDLADAVIVAAPTTQHFEITMQAIAAKKHVLVEKPIAATTDEAAQMIEAAEAAGVVLAGGHVERCNPAVRTLTSWVEAPVHIRVERTNPFTPRIQDGVILDLMIHDLDVVRTLVGNSEVVSISGVAQQIRGDIEEMASVTLGFDSGVTASLTASRLGQRKVREIEVCEIDRVLRADLLRQDLEIDRLSRSEYLSDDGVRYRESSMTEMPFIENRREPLMTQFELFADATRGSGAPAVSGLEAMKALELARQVEAAVDRYPK